MDNKADFSDQMDNPCVDTEAASWIAQIDGGKLSSEDRLALAEWISRSPRHAQSLRSMAALWGDVDLVLDDLILNREETSYKSVLGSWFAVKPTQLAAAASAVAIFVAALLISPALFVLQDGGETLQGQTASSETGVSTRVFRTEKGQNKTFQLADGSSVHLNTDSITEVQFSKEMRTVRLLRGEALFEVAKDETRPFEVFAGNGRVEAVGTAFVVRVNSDAVDLTVTEGKVQVDRVIEVDDAVEAVRAPLPVIEPLIVEAGHRVRVREEIEQVAKIDQDAIERQTAWRSGQIFFDGETLEYCIAEIGRYRSERIVIADPALRNRRVGGVFEVGELDSLLLALEVSMDINVERVEDDLVYLTAK